MSKPEPVRSGAGGICYLFCPGVMLALTADEFYPLSGCGKFGQAIDPLTGQASEGCAPEPMRRNSRRVDPYRILSTLEIFQHADSEQEYSQPSGIKGDRATWWRSGLSLEPMVLTMRSSSRVEHVSNSKQRRLVALGRIELPTPWLQAVNRVITTDCDRVRLAAIHALAVVVLAFRQVA